MTYTISPFYFPNGKPTKQHNEDLLESITTVQKIYSSRPYLYEPEFLPVSKACQLPIFMNIAFFHKLEILGNSESKVSFSTFIEGWTSLKRNIYDDESLYFNIIKKPDCSYVSPEDFFPILEDVVINHPGLRFLNDDSMFQERYIETVICRIYYEAKCTTGKMTLSQFKTSQFTKMIKNLTPRIDLNKTKDCFSYKHFYVLYCKFWLLDEDHNLVISEYDLERYNDNILPKKMVRQIMQRGTIPAFSRNQSAFSIYNTKEKTLTYLDYIWFFISETDKSTTVAIEYWFRCMDHDGDGIITTFDLFEYWIEQELKLEDIIDPYNEDAVKFDDIIRQMNDLIQPEVPGQYRLKDLKKNGIVAERFFDTFINIDKFQIHDAHLNLIRENPDLMKEKKRQFELEQKKFLDIKRHVIHRPDLLEQQQELISCLEPLCLGSWSDYAESEYESLLLNEQHRDEDEEHDKEAERQKENLQWSMLVQQFQQKNVAYDYPEEDDSSSSSGEENEEVECATPSTPILISNDDHQYLNTSNNKKIITDWMWRTTLS